MPPSSNEKETDITVYGATSFVAKHVLRYLAKVIEVEKLDKMRITLGGRNPSKLQAVKEEFSHCSSISDVFIASGSDLDLLRRMAGRTHVVLNCAGPYSQYSNFVVQACVEQGADYVDFTGEGYWSAVMRQKHGDACQKSGARIISMCGYDSIPSDLTVLAAVQALRNEFANNPAPVIQEIKIWHQAFGLANGGTIHTALDYEYNPIRDFFTTPNDTASGTRKRQMRPVPFFVGDPLLLTHPKTVRHNPDYTPHRNSFALGEWRNQLLNIEPNFCYGISIPMLMAPINMKVVQASAIALEYGSKDIQIRERLLPLGFFGTRLASIFALIPSLFVQTSILLGMAILKTPFLGKFLCDYFAPPGSGAPDWMVDIGSCATYVEVSTSPDPQTGTVHRGYAHLAFQGDPGNAATAQCVCESALALLLNREDLPPNSLDGFGTPAAILGPALLKRFQNAKARPVTVSTLARKGVSKNEMKLYL